MTFAEAIPILNVGGQVRSLNWRYNEYLRIDKERQCFSRHSIVIQPWQGKERLSEVHPLTYIDISNEDRLGEWEVFDVTKCYDDAKAFFGGNK